MSIHLYIYIYRYTSITYPLARIQWSKEVLIIGKRPASSVRLPNPMVYTEVKLLKFSICHAGGKMTCPGDLNKRNQNEKSMNKWFKD